MKKSILKITLAVLTIAIAISSCNKKEGCTDEEATNYDSEVKEKNDDGSCTYEGQYTIWIEQGFVDYYTDQFPITITAEDKELGTLTVTDFLDSAPECGTTDKAITFTIDLGSSKSKEIDLTILNSGGTDIGYIYSITVDAGDCGVGRL